MHVNHNYISYDWINPSTFDAFIDASAYAVGGLITVYTVVQKVVQKV